MTEQEEFEFRFRLEKEREAAKTTKVQQAAPHSAMQAFSSLVLPGLSAAKGITDTIGGAAQFVGHAIDPRIGAVVDERLGQFNSGYNDLRQRLGGETALPDVGRVIGSSILPMKAVGAINAAAPAITKAPGVGGALTRAAMGAGQGAAMAAVQPTQGGEGYWSDVAKNAGIGGAIGGAVPLAVDATRGAKNFVQGVAAPFSEAGRNRIGQEYEFALMNKDKQVAKEVIDRARHAKSLEIVHGNAPSVGDALSHEPKVSSATGVVSHENFLSKKEGLSAIWKPYLDTKRQALVDAIRKWGKTPADVAKASQDASDIARLNFEAASKDTVLADKTLLRLFNDPAMKEALNDAAVVSRLERAATGSTAPFLFGKTRFQNGTKLPVGDLHRVKTALDDMIKSPEDSAITRSTRRALVQFRNTFTEWLKDKSSAYKFAEETHQKLMKPIDRMKVGQYLANKLDDALGQENPKAFANAAQDLPDTIEKVTGFPVAKASQTLTPKQIKSTELVAEELARKATYKDLSRGTRLSGGISDQPYGVEGSPFPSFLSWKAAIGNKIMRMGGRDANELVKAIVSAKYQHPEQYAEWMDQYVQGLSKEEKARVVTDALVRQAIMPLSVNAATKMQP